MTSPALQIQTGHGKLTLALSFQPLTIGRDPENLLHLDDEAVSPFHCIIVRIASEVHVLDLRSRSGSLVNGQPVQWARLTPNDVLRVGRAEIRLARPRTDAYSEPPSSQSAPERIKTDAGTLGPVPVSSASQAADSHVEQPEQAGGSIKIVPDPHEDRPPYIPPPKVIGELMLPREMDDAVRGFLRRAAGMVVICGPSGSGRTTTAYAMLRHLLAGQRRVVTFEQPPELQLDGAVQIFVHDVRQYAQQIEQMMKSEPQVLMLGEPPTVPAALAALRASIGRCLTVTVAHAADALRLIHGWLEQGVQPRTLAGGLSMVISQRLVRRLCDQCKSPVAIEEESARRKLAPFLPHIEHIYVADSCPHCNNTGFIGRIGVFEVLQVTDELRAAILASHATPENLRHATDPHHYIPLALSAYARVAQGLTTLEEADAMLAAPSPEPATQPHHERPSITRA